MIIADTDVLIDFLASRGPARQPVAVALEQGNLCTTSITRFELLCGARNTRQENTILTLLTAIPTLPLDEAASDRAARVRRKLDGAGETIGMADSLIAGIVLCHGGIFLTRNRRHFQRVVGLALYDLDSSPN
jgi:predicted nucleic acid-binding protein